MNCQEQKPRERKSRAVKPLEIRDGNTKLKIYSGQCVKRGRKYPLFTLCYYEGGRRQRKTFGALASAKEEAAKVAARLERGERDVMKLTNSDQQTFALATREMEPLGVPLLDAVRQYIAASKALPDGTSLLEAANDYAKRHPSNAPRKTIPQVVEEFFATKDQDGASKVYLRTLRYHLKPFAERFQTPINNITARDVDGWLRTMGHTARTRKNALVSLTTLFRFARSMGYLPKHAPTEIESIARPKTRSGEIGTITPDELRTILHSADTDERKIYFSLGAFTGIRATELSRLEWKDIDLARRHVQIAADKAKTATRRLVPICDALYAWLLPYSSRTGHVFTSQRSAERLVEWAGKKIGRWPKNALRHSFVSYRVAQTQNVAQTALEAGNSPAMVFSNYREIVDPAAANEWFSIMPADESGKVIPMKAGAA